MIEKTPITLYEGETNPYEEVDYLEQSRELVTEQFKGRDIFDRYLQLLVSGKTEIAQAVKDVMQNRSLFNASGKQLDVIGDILGLSRQLFDAATINYFGFEGATGAIGYGSVNEEETLGEWKSINDPLLGARELTDTEYRILLKIKIIKNTSNATITAFTDAARLLFGVENVFYQEDKAQLIVNIGREYSDSTLSPFPGLDEIELASRFLNVPIGVGFDLQPPAALSLDFVNNSYGIYQEGTPTLAPKAFSDLVTFTRGSSGTYFDSAGVLQTAAANTHRLTHDPATLAPLGYLAEEQRANLALQSEAFDLSPWATASRGAGGTITITPNHANSPDGTLTADRLEISVSGTTFSDGVIRRQSITLGNANTHAEAVWLKSNDSNNYEIGLHINGGTVGPFTVTPDWQRFDTTIDNPNATQNVGIEIRGSYVNPSQTVDILAWGFQFEEGTFPTSYIKTTTATVTRSPDVAKRTMGSELNLSEGTLYVQAFSKDADEIITIAPRYLTLSDGTLNNRMIIYRSTNKKYGFFANKGGVLQVSVTNGDWPNNTQSKIAVAYGPGGYLFAVDGEILTTVSGEVPTVTQMTVGTREDNTENWQPNAPIQDAEYIPYAMTRTDLILKTKPDSVVAAKTTIDTTTDASIELNFVSDFAIIQTEAN